VHECQLVGKRFGVTQEVIRGGGRDAPDPPSLGYAPSLAIYNGLRLRNKPSF
jgi:hypothetical protein